MASRMPRTGELWVQVQDSKKGVLIGPVRRSSVSVFFPRDGGWSKSATSIPLKGFLKDYMFWGEEG